MDDQNDRTYQREEKVPSLKEIMTQYFTDKIHETLKGYMAEGLDTQYIVTQVKNMIKPLNGDIVDMIRRSLIYKYGNKFFRRLDGGGIQYFDGHIETKAQQLNPLYQYRADRSGNGSPWSNKNIEDVIEAYIYVHLVRKSSSPHPTTPTPEYPENDTPDLNLDIPNQAPGHGPLFF